MRRQARPVGIMRMANQRSAVEPENQRPVFEGAEHHGHATIFQHVQRFHYRCRDAKPSDSIGPECARYPCLWVKD